MKIKKGNEEKKTKKENDDYNKGKIEFRIKLKISLKV